MSNDKYIITRKLKLLPIGEEEEVNRVYDYIRNGQYSQYNALNILMGQLASKYYECKRDLSSAEFKEAQKSILSNSNPNLCDIEFAKGCDTMNNPVPVSLLSGDRKPQIRFLGNHHSGSGNLYHKSFRM